MQDSNNISSRRSMIALAAILAALAVAFGAYAAHGLVGRIESLGYTDDLPKRIGWFETGAKYQFYHALGSLVVIALSATTLTSQASRRACFAFVLGTLLFSGSLYVMTFAPAEWKKLGAVTPLGGLSFMVGWLIVAVGAFRQQSQE